MSYIDTQNLLPQMKTYLPWLAEADSQALKYSCRQLDNAYKGFFKDGKGFPQFKRKRGEESYTTTKAKSIKVDDKYIQLPTLGNLANPGWSLTHPSYIVFGFILNAALCFEIVYIDIKFGEK